MDILASFGNGLLVVLQPNNLMYCFIGVFLGTFIGVLPGIGSMAAIAMILPILSGDSRSVAESVIVTRSSWTQELLNQLTAKSIDPKSISDSTVRRMLFHQDAKIQSKVTKVFGDVTGATDSKMRETIAVYLKPLTAARSFWMKSLNYQFKHKFDCYVYLRPANLFVLALQK